MSAPEPMVTSKTVDLTNCDREQIQYVGAIQPHGALLVLKEPELLILQASRNTAELLGVAAEELVKGSLRNLFTEEQIDPMRRIFLQEPLAGAPIHVARVEFSGREFDVLAHRNDRVLILELEARSQKPGISVPNLYSSLHAAISTLEGTTSLQSFLDLTAGQIRLFTGFDRVMIYKFMEDESGWVRAEALTEGLEPYLGLHYPASDIPAPARRLFSLTWVRHQPDIFYAPVPIFPETNPVTGEPLDMSYSLLRSVSVMYVDYLKNMGTTSSMVLTLLKRGKLWGLVACHHHSGPRYVPHETRVACGFVAHVVSLMMSAKEDIEHHEYRLNLKSTQTMMLENIGRRGDLVHGFVLDSPNLLDFVRSDGAATAVNGEITLVGRTPSAGEIEQIVKWLPSAMSGHFFATDCLSAHLPEAAAFKDLCAGLMAVRVSDTQDDFLLWFRPEVVLTVNWAGDPRKPVDISGDGRLHPRSSFALWKETVRLKSSPWLEVEVEAVQALRAGFSELVLRLRAEKLDRLSSDLARSNIELQQFAYIASHDLQSPLRSISGFVQLLKLEYEDKLGAQAVDWIRRTVQAIEQMQTMIREVLAYSRVDSRSLPFAPIPFLDIFNDAVELLKSSIQDAQAQVLCGELPVVVGDRSQLVQLMQNLIGNGIKYHGDKSPRVYVSAERNGSEWIFSVRDNGIGIDPKYFEQIFEIFKRLHDQKEYPGTGIGLAICRRVVSRHGGRIWLESEAGHGSVFHFTLLGAMDRT